jgi:hypothetical protein
MGLLALDRNKDKVIDSGAELFGDGTKTADGRNYANGYLALAAHDDNGDGVIDAKDSVFEHLLVWQDLNIDGRSSASELKPLSSYGVTSISVVYGPSVRHGSPQLGKNDVRYEGRYFGPERCGKEGCLTFDVFFATATSLASK